jgi:acetyltransferase
LDLKTLFEPETMAVVGVSLSNDRHPANVIYNKNSLRYPVRVYGVNPSGGTYYKDRIYKNLSEIPEKLDLVIVAVKAEHVPSVLSECIDCWVGGAAVISGGFAETGNRELRDEFMKIAERADFPIIGPNCLGIYSPTMVDSFFLPSERMVRPERGNVAIVSQSGGILVDQMVKFTGQGVGLSRAISIGNKAVVNELDLIKFFARDDLTDVISFYIEGFGPGEGRKFIEAAAKCPKPVITMKAGKSSAGTRAVSSHTASLAGDYTVFSSVMKQFGLVEARDEHEMISFCESLSCYSRPIGGNVGIVTASGGHGAVAVDTCEQSVLTVPAISEDIQEKIREKLTPGIRNIASLGNPLDLTGSARDDDFVAAASYLSGYRDIDCILVLLLPYLPEVTSDVGARLSQLYHEDGKPIIAYVPHVEKYRMIIEGFQLNNVPVAHSIEGAVLMAEAMKRCTPW